MTRGQTEAALKVAYQRWANDPELERLILTAIRTWPARDNAERRDSVMDVASLAFAAGWDARVVPVQDAKVTCSRCGRPRALREVVAIMRENLACDVICKEGECAP